ncbi:MAG: hypothetical protein OXP71_11465 [Candidatus Poribacteria bacterium]|nr:hypothetical protein [Candidatus Poribacteria bacterium]
MYFTLIGRKRDLEVVQQYYQEDWWLGQIIVNDDRAVISAATRTAMKLRRLKHIWM